jgi:hypothetical protein
MAARSKLSPKQKTFVDAKMEGATDTAAAALAGCATAVAFRNSEAVRVELAAARRWLTDVTQIRRLDVIEGMLEAIEMARHIGDPSAMIKGWVEISKLLGYAVADVKVTNLTINQMQLRSKFESMPLEELLAISEGRTVDGESQKVS